jgi:hypothetical protein
LTILEGSHVEAVVPLLIATRVDIFELVPLVDDLAVPPVLNAGAPFTTWQFVVAVQLERIDASHGGKAGALDCLGRTAKACD